MEITCPKCNWLGELDHWWDQGMVSMEGESVLFEVEHECENCECSLEVCIYAKIHTTDINEN